MAGRWDLLWLNYQFLPVGNAYCEYQVKLIKNSRCQDARTDTTLSRKIRAGTVSHVFQMWAGDFSTSRVALGHNVKPVRKPIEEPEDLGYLATAMIGGGCSEVTFVVQSIIGVKGRGKALRYQVNWKGSGATSWEPITNLTGAQDAIDKFNKQK